MTKPSKTVPRFTKQLVTSPVRLVLVADLDVNGFFGSKRIGITIFLYGFCATKVEDLMKRLDVVASVTVIYAHSSSAGNKSVLMFAVIHSTYSRSTAIETRRLIVTSHNIVMIVFDCRCRAR